MAITGDAEPSPGGVYVAEPLVQYHAWPPAVVDSSLVCALVFDEDGSAALASSVNRRALHAPDLLTYEVANVAMNKIRRGTPAAAVQPALLGLPALGVSLHAVEPEAALNLAIRYRLSAYDAAYLVLAEALRCPLLTLDRRLAEAAQQHLGSLE
jgi:predicted nucleic acid-binding protein